MICPQCKNSCRKNGVNRSGTQRYYCKHCKKSFTNSSNKQGRPSINDKPMTSTQRSKRHRKKTAE